MIISSYRLFHKLSIIILRNVPLFPVVTRHLVTTPFCLLQQHYPAPLLSTMPVVAIQPGATVFVTGVNGLIGSHIVDQLLKMGYNVRGAVRDVEGSRWLKEYFDKKYEGRSAKLELVSVLDMTVEGCYDEVVKGVSYGTFQSTPETMH